MSIPAASPPPDRHGRPDQPDQTDQPDQPDQGVVVSSIGTSAPAAAAGYRLRVVPDPRPPAMRTTDVAAILQALQDAPDRTGHRAQDGVTGASATPVIGRTDTEVDTDPDAAVPAAEHRRDDAAADRRRHRTAQVAEAEIFVRRLLPPLVEVFRGRRPAPQLSACLGPGAYAQVAAVARRSSRSRDSAPVGCGTVEGWPLRPGVVDVVARLSRGARSIAVALRVEWRVDRWICTVVDLGPWGFAFTAPLESVASR